MVAGIDRFLMREIEQSVEARPKLWQRDFSSPEAYEMSVQPNRERFRKYIGATDPRLPEAGWRLLAAAPLPTTALEVDWDRHRLALGLPDGSHDWSLRRPCCWRRASTN